MPRCFAFAAATADDQPATLSVYDEIGFWGVQAKEFRDQLSAVNSSVLNVEINSPGGDMFAGIAIHNMLRSSGKEIVVKVMGVAASAASLIAMAGDKIIMPSNTMMMIHKPWIDTAGNDDELREMADTLTKFNQSVINAYRNKTGLKEEELIEMLSKDTWLTADEALAKGFATEVVDEIKVSAKFDVTRAELPESVKAALGLVRASTDPDEEEQARQRAEQEAAAAAAAAAEAAEAQARLEAEAAARIKANPVAQQINDLAVSADLADFAPLMAVSCKDVSEAQIRIAAAKEIKSICAFAKRPDAAANYIKANKTVAEARAEIIKTMAESDVSIDTARRVKDPQASGSTTDLNPTNIWAKHNNQSKAKKGS